MEVAWAVIFFLVIAWMVGSSVKKVSQNPTASKLGLSLLDRWLKK